MTFATVRTGGLRPPAGAPHADQDGRCAACADHTNGVPKRVPNSANLTPPKPVVRRRTWLWFWRHRTPGGLDAVVTDARLCVGPPGRGADGGGYCYATPMSAILGAARWIEDACRDEPAGWTRDPRTGRTRVGGVAKRGERAWVCPRHSDRLPTFADGRLFCASCGRRLEVSRGPPAPRSNDRGSSPAQAKRVPHDRGRHVGTACTNEAARPRGTGRMTPCRPWRTRTARAPGGLVLGDDGPGRAFRGAAGAGGAAGRRGVRCAAGCDRRRLAGRRRDGRAGRLRGRLHEPEQRADDGRPPR